MFGVVEGRVEESEVVLGPFSFTDRQSLWLFLHEFRPQVPITALLTTRSPRRFKAQRPVRTWLPGCGVTGQASRSGSSIRPLGLPEPTALEPSSSGRSGTLHLRKTIGETVGNSALWGGDCRGHCTTSSGENRARLAFGSSAGTSRRSAQARSRRACGGSRCRSLAR